MRGIHKPKSSAGGKNFGGLGFFVCVFGLFVCLGFFLKALESQNDRNDDKHPGRAGTRRGTSERKEFCWSVNFKLLG